MDSEQYLDELNQTRATEAQAEAELPPAPEKPEVSFSGFGCALAIFNDIITVLPAVSDATGPLASGFRWYQRMKQVGKKRIGNLNLGVVTFIKLIPGVNILPAYTIEFFLTHSQEKAAAEKEYAEAMTAYQEQLETD